MANRTQFAGAPNWAPLEAVIPETGLLVESGTRPVSEIYGMLHRGEFMWMGYHIIDGNATVELYKHRDTRRYLCLDQHGRTYSYDPNDENKYVEIEPKGAIRSVLR